MMSYDCGAGMLVAAKEIKLLKENQTNELLAIAHKELKIGSELMDRRYRLWNSIRWNRSRVGVKRDIASKMSRVTFDAKTAYLTAKVAFDEFMSEVQISQTVEVNRLLKIHTCLYSVGEWFVKYSADRHQLRLEILLEVA
ncbi:hypothetical protein [Chamaesiphon sp.]|uniref:hypothetical protein n=1 Tax=Chamaesiphon sp. TaxID=2814140 RepID=UPI003593BB14